MAVRPLMHEYPPPSADEIRRVEQRTGYKLPEILLDLYARRGNGGFGPEYGLLGLASGHATDLDDTALDLYESFRSADPDDQEWQWPEHLLPLLHIGCGIHDCIDLRPPHFSVVRFDPNDHELGEPWGAAFTVVHEALEEWLKGMAAEA